MVQVIDRIEDAGRAESIKFRVHRSPVELFAEVGDGMKG
jgi:hypothetical protein